MTDEKPKPSAPPKAKPHRPWDSTSPDGQSPEEQLGEYIADYLEGWHIDSAEKRDGVGSFIEIKMHDESSHDNITIHADRNSQLGRILTALHTLRFP